MVGKGRKDAGQLTCHAAEGRPPCFDHGENHELLLDIAANPRRTANVRSHTVLTVCVCVRVCVRVGMTAMESRTLARAV